MVHSVLGREFQPRGPSGGSGDHPQGILHLIVCRSVLLHVVVPVVKVLLGDVTTVARHSCFAVHVLPVQQVALSG